MKKIYRYFLKHLKQNPKKICLDVDGKIFSFSQINELINYFEKYITLDTKKIGFLSPNSEFHYALFLLCSKKNILLSPLDFNCSDEVLLKQIEYANLDLIIYNNINPAIINKFKRKKINLINVESKKKFISVNQANISINLAKNFNSLSKDYLLSFTSGSTGTPKPIIFSEKCKIRRSLSAIKIFDIKKNYKSLITTPLHHSLAMRIMIISIILGIKLFVLNRTNMLNIVNTIKNNKINFTIFVSNQIKEILTNEKNIKKLNSLNSLISSSAGISLENKKKIIKIYKKNFFEMYGLAELGIVTYINFNQKKRFLNSVGMAVEGVKIKIDSKNRNNKIGEILCKSTYQFNKYLGYNKNKNYINNGYFKTGDYGYIDKNHLYYVGRKKNMLKINGVAVYPEDIENKLNKLAYINECVISGVSNFDENNWLCLIYKKNKIGRNIDLKIRKYCMDNLSSFHMPRYFLEVDSLPKNRMNKIDRNEIAKIIKKEITNE